MILRGVFIYPKVNLIVIGSIIEMLHYNASQMEDNSHRGAATINAPLEASIWKVLVLDAVGQRILSPVMKVNDLRDHGVTLYLYTSPHTDGHLLLSRQLHSDRQPIPEVPAIYFVEPTAENILRIGQDLQANMYDTFYLNFTSSLPRALMEDLAHSSVQSSTSALIAKVRCSCKESLILDRFMTNI